MAVLLKKNKKHSFVLPWKHCSGENKIVEQICYKIVIINSQIKQMQVQKQIQLFKTKY